MKKERASQREREGGREGGRERGGGREGGREGMEGDGAADGELGKQRRGAIERAPMGRGGGEILAGHDGYAVYQ